MVEDVNPTVDGVLRLELAAGDTYDIFFRNVVGSFRAVKHSVSRISGSCDSCLLAVDWPKRYGELGIVHWLRMTTRLYPLHEFSAG